MSCWSPLASDFQSVAVHKLSQFQTVEWPRRTLLYHCSVVRQKAPGTSGFISWVNDVWCSALAAHSLTPERFVQVMTIAVIESILHCVLHCASLVALLSWNDEKADDGTTFWLWGIWSHSVQLLMSDSAKMLRCISYIYPVIVKVIRMCSLAVLIFPSRESTSGK